MDDKMREEFGEVAYAYRSWPGYDVAGVAARFEELCQYVAAIRRAALEEAAKACEERARGHFQMSPAAAECDECAAACRALAAKEPVL